MQEQYLTYERGNIAAEWGAHFEKRRAQKTVAEPETIVYVLGDAANIAASYPRRQKMTNMAV